MSDFSDSALVSSLLVLLYDGVSTKSQPHTLCTHDRKDWCHSYKLWWAGQIGVNKVTTTNIMLGYKQKDETVEERVWYG